MMKNMRITLWGMIVCACILAGCGGGSDSSTPPINATPPVLSPNTADNSERPNLGDIRLIELMAPRRPHGDEMAGFSYIGNNSYANASLKFLMSSIGSNKLLNHLENFIKTTQNEKTRVAAEKFVELINKTYQTKSSLRYEVKEFIDILQPLAPFNQLNEQGALKFNVNIANNPHDFIDLIADLFQLNTLPGWSLDIKDTFMQDEKILIDDIDIFNSRMYRAAPLNLLAQKIPTEINLQRVVDLIQTGITTWLPSESQEMQPGKVKLLRQARIANVDQFTRLTILPVTGGLPYAPRMNYQLDDRATLSAHDLKSGKKIVLTLVPKEQIISEDGRYYVNLKNATGHWESHFDDVVRPTIAARTSSLLMMMNLAVVSKEAAE